VLVLTFNEEPNIASTLDGLSWAKNILVIDSGSTDRTLEIVSAYPQARVVYRRFDSFAGQCNFGLDHITTEWTLSIDADYRFDRAIGHEIARLAPPSDLAGYFAKFRYAIHGAQLKSSLYPPRCVLYRTKTARYRDEGHGHRVVISGKTSWLQHYVVHDDRKPLSRWFNSQQGYAQREAAFLASAPRSDLKFVDRLRALAWPMPFIAFFYTLLVKGCLFQGAPGWHYTLQRTLAEIIIALVIVENKLSARQLKPLSSGAQSLSSAPGDLSPPPQSGQGLG
jgi:glycosyltransferase involved in cell wall biosynthesis